jgi:hypothetical protein
MLLGIGDLKNGKSALRPLRHKPKVLAVIGLLSNLALFICRLVSDKATDAGVSSNY